MLKSLDTWINAIKYKKQGNGNVIIKFDDFIRGEYQNEMISIFRFIHIFPIRNVRKMWQNTVFDYNFFRGRISKMILDVLCREF